MKLVLLNIISIAIAAMIATSCGSKPPIKDPNPPVIDVGHKRVETIICGNRNVGENGCVFAGGKISGTLKIYRVVEGQVVITGQGCNVDQSISYGKSTDEWLTIDLKSIIGGDITEDCVLSISQYPKFNGQDGAEFPVRGMQGTVLLGTCPADTKCSYTAEQRRAGSSIPVWSPKLPAAGDYLVQGCGATVVPQTSFTDGVKVDLKALWPNGYPADGKVGCTFIMGVRGADGSKMKIYRKVWLYKRATILLPQPVIEGSSITGDQYVSLTVVDGVSTLSNVATYEAKADGNMLRFYTTQGRSLVVKVKDGKIEWTQ